METEETEVKTKTVDADADSSDIETKAKATETEPPSKPAKPERIEADEDTDEDDRASSARDYKAMRKGLVKNAKGIKHSGKAGNLFAHADDMKAHWQNHEDDQGEDAAEKGYHTPSEIKAMLGKAPGCKGCACQKGIPSGGGWEKLKHKDEAEDKDEKAKVTEDDKDKEDQDETEAETKAAKDMAEGSGAAGGYVFGSGGKEKDKDKPAKEKTEDDDEPSKPEPEEIRRGHSVEIVGGGQKGFGKVVSIHKDGDFVPDVDDHVIGTDDEPAARVHRHKKMGDGFEQTGHYTGHKCMDLKRVPELKGPGKKGGAVVTTDKTAAPVAATKTAPKPEPKPEPAPVKKTLPPIEDVGMDLDVARSFLLGETVKMLREDGQKQLDRKLGVV